MPIAQVPSQLAQILARGTYDADWYPGATYEAKVQNAINAAAADGAARVLVHQSYDASLIAFNTAVQMVREGGDWSKYDVKAYGAYGNGTTDDTVAMQAAFHAAGLVGGIVWTPAGVYVVGTSLIVSSLTTIDGVGADYLQTGKASVIQVKQNGILAGVPLFDVSNTSFVTIKNIKAQVAGNDSTFNTTLAIADLGGACSALAVDRCHFQWFGGATMKIQGGTCVITRNRGNNCNSHFIWLANGASDNFVAFNESGALQSVVAADAVRVENGANNTITLNHLYNFKYGINLTGATPAYNSVTLNRCEKHQNAGINVEAGARGGQVVGNWCFNNGTAGSGQGIRVSGAADGVLVEGNYCFDDAAYPSSGNQSAGILISGASVGINVHGNHTRGNTVGIDCNTGVNCHISGNDDKIARQYSISLTSAVDCQVDDNYCFKGGQQTDNTYDAIILVSNCVNNTVSNNIVRHGGGAAQYRFAVRINAASCTGNRVLNNDLRTAGKNAAGPVSDAGVVTMKQSNWITAGALTGQVALAAANPAATVNTAEIQTGDTILLSRLAAGGTLGHLSIGAIVNGTSFTIVASGNLDTSTVAWEIVH